MKQKIYHLQSLFAVTLCLIMSLSFVSCGDDENEPNEPLINSLVGKWVNTESYPGYEDEYFQYEFKSDGSYYYKIWDAASKEPDYCEDSGTWKVSGDKLTLYSKEYDPMTYRFTLDGKKLSIYDWSDDGSITVFVKK